MRFLLFLLLGSYLRLYICFLYFPAETVPWAPQEDPYYFGVLVVGGILQPLTAERACCQRGGVQGVFVYMWTDY